MHIKLSIHGILILLLLQTGAVSTVQAACTYNEAIMAYQQHNSIRGLALMRMAASDGDTRAARYLSGIGDRIVNPEIGDEMIAGASINAAPNTPHSNVAATQ